jgi:hypothetical protein
MHPSISNHSALGRSVAMLHYLLPSWDMFFEFHGKVRGGECHSGGGVRSSNGGSSLRGDEEFSW